MQGSAPAAQVGPKDMPAGSQCGCDGNAEAVSEPCSFINLCNPWRKKNVKLLWELATSQKPSLSQCSIHRLQHSSVNAHNALFFPWGECFTQASSSGASPTKKLQGFRPETTAGKLQGSTEKVNSPVLPSFLDFKAYVGEGS